MKKNRVPRLQRTVEYFEPLHRFADSLGIRAGLIAVSAMLNAAKEMRASENLQTAIVARGAIDGDHAARHVRIKTAVLVPVSIILVPLPRPADVRLLQNHFGV